MLHLFCACFDKNIYFVDSLSVFISKSEYAILMIVMQSLK